MPTSPQRRKVDGEPGVVVRRRHEIESADQEDKVK
jgi:hypothetical protein